MVEKADRMQRRSEKHDLRFQVDEPRVRRAASEAVVEAMAGGEVGGVGADRGNAGRRVGTAMGSGPGTDALGETALVRGGGGERRIERRHLGLVRVVPVGR